VIGGRLFLQGEQNSKRPLTALTGRFLLASCVKADESLYLKINASWENDAFSWRCIRCGGFVGCHA